MALAGECWGCKPREGGKICPGQLAAAAGACQSFSASASGNVTHIPIYTYWPNMIIRGYDQGKECVACHLKCCWHLLIQQCKTYVKS